MKKRLFSLFMSLIMVVSLAAVMPAMTAGAETSGDYEYEILDDGTVEITDYNGSATNLTIPSTIAGKKVTSICYYAFDHCSSLTSITIPNSVTSIGSGAFFYCSSLANVTIPDSVTSIGKFAFSGCSSLTSVTIPDSVTSIGYEAFSWCSSLTNINVASNNKNYSSKDGVLFNKDKTELIQYPIGNARISYTIPNSVTKIGNFAFDHCSSLTSITIPDSVTSIGDEAFSGCSSLTSVTIPDSVTSIENFAFDHCSSLTSITIPDSVTSIGDYAFGDCSSLTSVTIPDSVTSIGNEAFSWCSSLTNINVASNNKNYSSKDGVLFNKDKTELIQYPIGNERISYTIPNSVTRIGNVAFGDCTSLKSVTIGNSVTSIGDGAFCGCSSLTSITIPNSVTKIGNFAFGDCSSLKSVTIGNSVTSIGGNAFGYYYDYAKVDGFKIKCYKGTAGEKYAKDNGFKYEYIDPKAPAAVTGFKTSTITSNSIKLMWNKVSGADGYIIYQKKSGKWTRIKKITTNTNTYAVNKLSGGTTYEFAVRAYKTVNGKEVLSPTYPQITATTNPANITKTNFTSSANAVKMSWNKVSGATGYRVYQYNTSTKKWKAVANTKNTSYTFSKLKSGTTYKFTVRAYKTYDGKTYLSPKYSTFTTSTNPATVSFKLSAGTNKVTVKWSKVTGATGYKVYYKTSKNGKWIGLKTTNNKTTSYTKTGLTKGKTYYFTVKAYRTVGGKTYNGSYNTKNVKVK